MDSNKPRIINCHTHIFTGDCVPPWLARTIIPAPLHFLLPVTKIVALVRWWFNSPRSPYQWIFQPWYKKLARILYLIKVNLTRYWILRLIKAIVGLIILLSIFHDTYSRVLKPMIESQEWLTSRLDRLDNWITTYGIFYIPDTIFVKAILLIILLLFFPSGRNLLWFLLTQMFKVLRMLPGKQTIAMLKRYINIIRFARYNNQSRIMSRLINQYPNGSAMVVLPMDMEFMGAGTQPKPFDQQMEELSKIKAKEPDQIFPFLFIDPRRTKAGEKDFFTYTIENNKVVPGDCFVREYIVDKQFSGFKIYPALGYFPFDEALLPLWKYAADNGIPIMTHCIRGVIYYRGRKKKEWDFHPVFEQAMGKDKNDESEDNDGYEPLLLPQMKAVDVQEIFTHPLNYACLLKKEWLAILVGKAKDPKIKTLFGYDETTKTIARDLAHLKICFGHFGGEDEWNKFFEKDRDNYSSQLVKVPEKGIDFLNDDKGIFKKGKAEQIWKSVDWYTIICSLMLQHENIYADISYILHGDQEILPLLKQTLRHPVLSQRVLYGSDFYVVRNHKSDKNMLADMMRGLAEKEFDQIARYNPLAYLKRSTGV
jgi:predicted TIM-barrel fold metal-dependent hydrolase